MLSLEMRENDHSVSFKLKYCRLCAWELSGGVHIFGEEGKRLQIPEKIRKTLAILVLEEDSLPKKICPECCSSLEDYSHYKDTVLDAQEKLASIAKYFPPPIFEQYQQENRPPRLAYGTSFTPAHYSNRKLNLGHGGPDIKLSRSENGTELIAIDVTSVLTCKDCGKRFRTRTDFDSHQALVHPIQTGHVHHSISTSTSSSTSRPFAIKSTPPQHYEPISLPSSPEGSHDPLERITTVNLEEEKVIDSKVGIRLIPSPKQKPPNIPTNPNSITGGPSGVETKVNAQIPSAANTKGNGPSRSPTTGKLSAKTNQCIYCDKILLTKSGLDQHLRIHKNRRFDCKDCGSSYAQKHSLTAHTLSCHTPGGKIVGRRAGADPVTFRFHCSMCPSTFTRKSTLNLHEKCHSEERNFVCTICQKSYKTNQCLGKHLKSHTATDAFPCKVCHKTFCRKSKLEEHENIHLERRPYGCNFCIHNFNSQSNYLRHVKRRHPEEVRDGKVPPHVKIVSDVAEKIVVVNNSQGQTQTQVQTRCESPACPSSSAVSETPEIYNCHLTSAASVSHSHTPSPAWVDLTGKQHHQVPQPLQNSQESQPQPLDMNVSVNYSLSQPQNQHQQLHSQNQNVEQLHIHQHQQHSIQQQIHQMQQHLHTQSNPIGQQHSQQHLSQQGPSSNNNHQQQSHSQSVQQSPTQTNSQNHSQFNGHHQQSHIQQSPNNHNQHQQHSYPHPLNQLTSHGQSNSQIHLQQPQNSHLLQMQTQSQQQHYGHQQLQTIPLQLSSQNQNHYPNSHNNHNHNHNQTLSTMDLVDCAIQSAFGSDSTVASASGSQQNHPMQLNYKLDSTSFQDMPMELTKVFQSGPLELCVRNDFNQLVDLTAKESSFNDRMNIIDFRQQPIDLISRNEVSGSPGLQSDNNNLVDLSLRSSFQDQSESIILRELIDLSSRPEYHGELNLSSKGQVSNNHKGNSIPNVVYSDTMFNL